MFCIYNLYICIIIYNIIVI